MKTAIRCGAGAWALALSIASVYAQTGAGLQIKPMFVPDELIIGLTEDQMPGGEPTGKTPADLYAAAGVTLLRDTPLTPPEVVLHAMDVKLNPGVKFGRAFRVAQTFSFGFGSRWSVSSVSPNGLGWIPESAPAHWQRLFNFSARAEVRKGDSVTIGGMVVPGEFPRLVVFKVTGPSLRQFGLDYVLANPRLKLFEQNERILENDDWGQLRDWEKTLAASVCPPPADPHEAMIVTYLDPGVYTAVVSDANGGEGVALLEMYLVDAFLVE